MTTDPKKNTEIKDEDLDQVAGGTGGAVDSHQTDGSAGGTGGGGPSSTDLGDPQKTNKI